MGNAIFRVNRLLWLESEFIRICKERLLHMAGMLFEGLYACWRMIEGDVGKTHPKIIPKIIIHPFKFKMF